MRTDRGCHSTGYATPFFLMHVKVLLSLVQQTARHDDAVPIPRLHPSYCCFPESDDEVVIPCIFMSCMPGLRDVYTCGTCPVSPPSPGS
jgi:hypothetical protein